MKIYIISDHRATNGAIEELKKLLEKKKLYTGFIKEADIVIAVSDREETFNRCLNAYRRNQYIVHLCAGEVGCWTTCDDVYRHSITLMSDIQLCFNDFDRFTVETLCNCIGKSANAHVIGNFRLDNLDTDESIIPDEEYDLVLYNPPSRLSDDSIRKEVSDILKQLDKYTIWIEPNGDRGSDLIGNLVKHYIIDRREPEIDWTPTMVRPQFLGLVKNCTRFLTNSSCQFTEAQFLMDKENIIQIGRRNSERNARYTDQSKVCNANDILDIILREWQKLHLSKKN